ncbi:hypothetical protein QK393_25835 [Pseudomonas aeruginosa]|nr:hypothetical protein [Pseudomonas aeruginosa]
MSKVKRLNFTVSQFESVVPYASEHGQYVRYTDYAKLEAEAQALMEEVAALRARVVVVPDAANDRRKSAHYCRGWNACLDELARLNGLTVSEGLLRRLCEPLLSHADYVVARNELRALLNQDKENGNG